jgi:hypothetical protein
VPTRPDATMRRSQPGPLAPAGSRRPAHLEHPAPSSRGQGHHPLKVETRVRIPLGLPENTCSEGGFPLLGPLPAGPADQQRTEEKPDPTRGRTGRARRTKSDQPTDRDAGQLLGAGGTEWRRISLALVADPRDGIVVLGDGLGRMCPFHAPRNRRSSGAQQTTR